MKPYLRQIWIFGPVLDRAAEGLNRVQAGARYAMLEAVDVKPLKHRNGLARKRGPRQTAGTDSQLAKMLKKRPTETA